jgi:excisionase family DNA binding protein
VRGYRRDRRTLNTSEQQGNSMSQHGPRGFLTISEAARRLGVARGTVYRMIQQGQLTKQTVGLRDYVRQYDVEVFSAAKLASQMSTTVVLELLDLFDQHPGLLTQLRALVDERGAS